MRTTTHLGVAEEVSVDKLGNAHLARARVGIRDPDRLDTVLDLDADGDNDGRREQVGVGKEEVLDGAEVARAGRLCEAPLCRAAADSAALGFPHLDAQLLGREGVTEERLGDGVREGDAREAFGVRGGGRPEALDGRERLVVVRRDVEGVWPVCAVEVGAVKEADRPCRGLCTREGDRGAATGSARARFGREVFVRVRASRAASFRVAAGLRLSHRAPPEVPLRAKPRGSFPPPPGPDTL